MKVQKKADNETKPHRVVVRDESTKKTASFTVLVGRDSTPEQTRDELSKLVESVAS